MGQPFAIFAAAACVVLTYAFGFNGFLVALGGSIALWCFTIMRGLLFIRAFAFLEALDRGQSVEAANAFAKHIDSNNPNLHEIAALAHKRVIQQHGGQQHPLIMEARSKGYK